LMSWVRFESGAIQRACKHGSRGISIVESR
jgi:hypothetical protein